MLSFFSQDVGIGLGKWQWEQYTTKWRKLRYDELLRHPVQDERRHCTSSHVKGKIMIDLYETAIGNHDKQS